MGASEGNTEYHPRRVPSSCESAQFSATEVCTPFADAAVSVSRVLGPHSITVSSIPKIGVLDAGPTVGMAIVKCNPKKSQDDIYASSDGKLGLEMET